ncbi:hypothetical protein VX159_02320 [Dechloromonas sp. ZY10]|uniref:hypothetical protein n=1 Tax=Dechloromonas aquae TaxID=2664436 RepID=UPI003528586E
MTTSIFAQFPRLRRHAPLATSHPTAGPRPGRWLYALLLGMGVLAMQSAGANCRIAYDLGSSGIRAGSSDGGDNPKRELPALTRLWAGDGIDAIGSDTAHTLRQLRAQLPLPANCAQLGAGYSAWRLAYQRDPAATVAALAAIRANSGVAILIAPQDLEGRYGYAGARQLLGERLQSSHILDLGGGSLQLAGAKGSYGDALGQKAWQKALCAALRPGQPLPCTLVPLADAELDRARALRDAKLAPLVGALPPPVTLTAISRPLSRGVLPALQKLLATPPDAAPEITRGELRAAIGRLAPLTAEAAATATGSPAGHLPYLLSDLLLVEGLLQATGAARLQVAEIDLSNVPGLLADPQAWRWQEAAAYACYLHRLERDGPAAAYAGDPASCAAAR